MIRNGRFLWEWKKSHMNVCEAHPCCCFSLLLIHTGGSVLPLRRNWVKERKGVWRRRIYRKYVSCWWLHTQDENLRTDIVLSMSRGSPGQWFPETEYVSVRHLCCGKSGIPPTLNYRSVMSYTLLLHFKILINNYWCLPHSKKKVSVT